MRARTKRGAVAYRERAIVHLMLAAECYRDAGDDHQAGQADSHAYERRHHDGWHVDYDDPAASTIPESVAEKLAALTTKKAKGKRIAFAHRYAKGGAR